MRRTVLAIVAVVVIAFGVVVLPTAGQVSAIDWYRVDSSTAMTVSVTTGSFRWVRVTDTKEGETSVTVTVRDFEIQMPGSSIGHPTELSVALTAPLGDRTVLDGTGHRVREYSPPLP